MAATDTLQKLYDKKQQEVHQLEIKLREATAYLQALQDSMRVLNREASGDNSGEAEQNLRAGSSISHARDVLRAAGKPLHINDLLAQMGKPVDKKNRLSLSGTLAGYVRGGQIFTRTGPNIFGLVEFGEVSPNAATAVPAEFGKMQ